MIKQSYLLTANWLNGLVADVDDVDPMAKRRVEFFMKMLTDAFSPSNFLTSNPAALQEVMATGGESLVQGHGELRRRPGSAAAAQLAITQTDYEMFKIGENVATAPGKVVFRNEIIELLQFSPTTEQVCEIPLLIFPPWINKFYILDLRPENSMIRWLASQGFTVFVASWVNPDAELADQDLRRLHARGHLRGHRGGDEADRRRPGEHRRLLHRRHPALLRPWPTWRRKGDKRDRLGHLLRRPAGLLRGRRPAAVHQRGLAAGPRSSRWTPAAACCPARPWPTPSTRCAANDLIWSFFVNNYLLGKEPKPFDLLFWNSDQTRMPKTLHLFYLRKFYGENALAKGELVLDGVQARPREVKTPIYVQSSKEDHIAPARSVYKGARLFGGPVTFTMAGSGHIAGVINAPVANKYQHWTNDALPARRRGMAGRRRGAPRLLVAALGRLAEGPLRQPDPRPRPGQGAAAAAGRRAGDLCEGEELDAFPPLFGEVTDRAAIRAGESGHAPTSEFGPHFPTLLASASCPSPVKGREEPY